MRSPKTLLILSFLTTVLFFSACKKFEDVKVVEDVNYEAEFAIPLINSKLSLQDIIDSEGDFEELEIDENGNMFLNYSAEFEHNTVDELLGEIPSIPLVLTDTTMTVPVQVFDNLELNSISLKSGTLSFSLHSSIAENTNVTITIPQLTKDGLTFSTNLDLIYQGTLPITASADQLPIEGYILDLTENSVQINYEAVTNSGDHIVLDLVTGSADDWNYELVEGIWDQQTFTISNDSIEVDLFGNWLDGEVSFEDPRLAVRVENSYGFPVSVQLKNAVAITSAGNEIPLTTTGNSFDVNYPLMNEQGEMKSTTFYFDKNNSNIKDILNAGPTKLIYEIEGTINPEDLNDPGFLTDQSDLMSLVTLELPAYGTASGFTIETTADIDLGEIENINGAEFKIITDNGLPIDVYLQLYFQDENENILDSLFHQSQAILGAASVDTQGNTVNSTEMVNYIDVSKERMLMIQNAKSVKIQASFSTTNDGNTSVIVNSSQELEIRMGAKIGLED